MINSRSYTFESVKMEKMKQLKNQALNAGKKGKEKLEAIQSKDWAEPTGKALKAAAGVVSVIPPPVGSVLKGALSMGGAVLNPDPTLADITRAKSEIKEEVKDAFIEVARDMGDIRGDLQDLRGGVKDVLKIFSDQAFYEGIATIDAYHKFYTDTGRLNLHDRQYLCPKKMANMVTNKKIACHKKPQCQFVNIVITQ